MEVVNQLPRPSDPAALGRLIQAQQLLCARAVSEEDCQQALDLLEELAAPVDSGGFDYFPALLTLASLHEAGFEPAIEQNLQKAAHCYLQCLAHDKAAGLATDLLENAAMQLCTLVRNSDVQLSKDQHGMLEGLSQGKAAGAVLGVQSWAKFAHAEVERLLKEAGEDPEVREKRLAREAARAACREQEIARQHEAARSVLAKVEDLRQSGNDACRSGQILGNANFRQDLQRATRLYHSAIDMLSASLPELTLVPEEVKVVRHQRCLLHSNTAQVWLTLEDWSRARESAEHAVRDDPEGAEPKPRYRLARAQVGLLDWQGAAQTVDESLCLLAGRVDADTFATRKELWKLAEEISKALPSWKWTSKKPEVKEQKGAVEDFEQRIIGKWEYSGGSFEIRLERWGALIFVEDTVKIDLMRKSKLRWRGEVELISGMVLDVAYEPGADVLVTDFTPPPDVPTEQQWKGPKKFTAKRIVQPTEEPEAPLLQSDLEEKSAEPLASTRAAVPREIPATMEPELLAEKKPDVPEYDGPKEVWLTGGATPHAAELHGRYELLPALDCAALDGNDRPAFRKAATAASPEPAYFLWFRGGNWGVTSAMHSSPLAAPFLARCPDTSGRARHPLELRRPRWHVRTKRGQEDFDPGLQALPLAPADEVALPEPECVKELAEDTATLAGSDKPVDALQRSLREPPRAVEISGRLGCYAEVNGRYELSDTLWGGHPMYVRKQQDEQEPLQLFCQHGYWMISDEVCSLPRAMARCAATNVESGVLHPGLESPGAPWEFLQQESSREGMVSQEVRTYVIDRLVTLRVSLSEEMTGDIEPHAPAAAKCVPDEALGDNARRDRSPALPARCETCTPIWVGSVSAELVDREVRVSVVVQAGIVVDMKNLCLEVASDSLKMALQGREDEALLLALPAFVDAEASPVARWSEKTRTLKLRLALNG